MCWIELDVKFRMCCWTGSKNLGFHETTLIKLN